MVDSSSLLDARLLPAAVLIVAALREERDAVNAVSTGTPRPVDGDVGSEQRPSHRAVVVPRGWRQLAVARVELRRGDRQPHRPVPRRGRSWWRSGRGVWLCAAWSRAWIGLVPSQRRMTLPPRPSPPAARAPHRGPAPRRSVW